MTTKGFLEQFGLDTLRDLPNLEGLEDAGLLNSDQPHDDFPSLSVDSGENSEF